jgi:hypothetical protein
MMAVVVHLLSWCPRPGVRFLFRQLLRSLRMQCHQRQRVVAYKVHIVNMDYSAKSHNGNQ